MLRPMYTAITVSTSPDDPAPLEGHAYDISRGGLSFELDRGLEPGTPVHMRLTLPEWLRELADGEGDEAGVRIRGTIVWMDDDDAPGPVRMAVVFTSFETMAERDLFFRTLGGHRTPVAA